MSSKAPEVAYLILGHHRPDQVRRLVKRILTLSARGMVLIHWDGSSSVPPPDDLPRRAEVIEARVRTDWGRWSLVAAELELLRAAAIRGAIWSVVISGVDWPARGLDDWEYELYSSGADVWMTSKPIQNRWLTSDMVPLDEDQVRRYEDSWLILRRPASKNIRRVSDGVARRAQSWASQRRRYPAVLNFYNHGYAVSLSKGGFPASGWTIHTGAQWKVLGRRASDVVLAAPEEVVSHFRRTLIPDEAFIHTVIRNTPGLQVVDRPTSYAPWERFGAHGGLDLVPEDVNAILESGAPFARKLPANSAMVESALDRAVGQAPNSARSVQ